MPYGTINSLYKAMQNHTMLSRMRPHMAVKSGPYEAILGNLRHQRALQGQIRPYKAKQDHTRPQKSTQRKLDTNRHRPTGNLPRNLLTVSRL